MKKTKLLIPTLLTLSAAGTLAPAITSCHKPTVYYTVSFNDDEGIVPISDIKVAKDGKIVEPETPVAIGRQFMGWFKEATCENQWNFAKDKVTKNTTLYAKWRDTGVTVDDNLWDKAFKTIGDRTQEQHFWYDGTIKNTTYDADGKVTKSTVLTDLIFNGYKHWYHAQEITPDSVKDIDVVGEYFWNFFFQGRRETTAAGKTVVYKNTDNTDATTLNEYIMNQSKLAGPQGTSRSIAYQKIGGDYIYSKTDANAVVMAKINFAENKIDPTIIQIENLYYYEYTVATKTEVEFDITINYENKEIVTPEGWDTCKDKARDGWGGLPYITISQPKEVSSGYVITAQHGSASYAGLNKIKFELNEKGSGQYPTYANGDVILCVDGNYYSLATASYASGVWTLPVTLTSTSSISLLVNKMPADQGKLYIELTK